METSIPLLFAAVVGFQHAFEADHLVAVSSIVSKRRSTLLAVKDGIFGGLGHTSTIL
jgi:high-affinity nickel permease